MIQKIQPSQLDSIKDLVIVDVRSEIEFEEGTIPGAINMPIFTQQEREEIGIHYKHISINEAKRIGIKYASRKLIDYFDLVQRNSDNNKKTLFFCWRGGLRSTVISATLSALSMRVFQLEGGYKAYRKHVISSLENFAHKYKYIVLHGHTGVGKTDLLNQLERLGYPVLDLEELANNKGSFFGEIGRGKPTNQKMFEALLFEKLKSFNSSYIFVESESKRIGRVVLPEFVVENIKNGFHVLIQTSLENRVSRLVRDYSSIDDKKSYDDILISCINKLRKSLGNVKVDEMTNKVLVGNYNEVARELLVEYYDPLYSYSQSKYENFDSIVNYSSIDNAIGLIIDFYNSIKDK